MKKIYVTIILLLTFCYQLTAQKGNTTKQLKTQVVVLNTCSPGELSIYWKESINKQYIRRLSINTNRFSAFKIDKVNPLRYKYYINGQLVTQFFDDNIALNESSNNNFGKPNPETINSILVFDTSNSRQLNIHPKLDSIQKIIDRYDDSIELNNEKYWANQYFLSTIARYDNKTYGYKLKPGKESSSNQKTLDSVIEVMNNLDAKRRTFYGQINKLEAKYNTMAEKLLSTKKIETILNFFMTLNTNKFTEGVYGLSTSIKSSAVGIMSNAGTTLKDITSLNSLLTKSSQINPDSLYSLVEKLSEYGIYIDNSNHSFDTPKIITFEFRKKVIDKMIDATEAFVMYASANIAELLQNSVIEGSRFKNLITNQTCIDTMSRKIDSAQAHYAAVYAYIQVIGENLNILMNQLEIRDQSTIQIVKNIEKNYKEILGYIKVLDFVDKNNTREFSMPMHNNLSNADFIRYTITQEDNLTKSSQKYTYDIWIKGGLKIDFSAGIFLSQLKDEMFNKNPVFITDTANQTQIVSDAIYLDKVDDGKYDFSFGAMVNMMWRTGASWLTPGLSAGVAYADNQKLQIMGGASLQLGKTQRLILHFGVAAGSIQELDESQLTLYPDPTVKLDGHNYIVKADINAFPIPYIQKFKVKPFFGLTYNLSSNKNAFKNISSKGLETFNNNGSISDNGTGSTSTSSSNTQN